MEWRKEPGLRVKSSRPLDDGKVQAPGAVLLPGGGVRLYYTAVGSAKPFAACQGYILSAISQDGFNFKPEPGIRLAPRPDLPHASLRLLSPTCHLCPDGRWRMYVEARGHALGPRAGDSRPGMQVSKPGGTPTLICSAHSHNGLDFEWEAGVRVSQPDGIRAPRYLPMPTSSCATAGKLLFCSNRGDALSATTTDGVNFELDTGFRLRTMKLPHDTGFSAVDVCPPLDTATAHEQRKWTMLFSTWTQAPVGARSDIPPHPSGDPDAVAKGTSAAFAEVSIAGDLNGHRSRIFVAHSDDGGLNFTTTPSGKFERGECVIEGSGYSPQRTVDGYGVDTDDAETVAEAGVDAVHAEDMCMLRTSE